MNEGSGCTDSLIGDHPSHPICLQQWDEADDEA